MTFEMWMICAAVVWVVCGLTAAGFDFAYFQDEYAPLAERDFARDLCDALTWGLFLGMPALIAVVWHTKCAHGWRLWQKRSNV